MIDRVKIKIIGKNPNYFLSLILKSNINLYHLSKTYNSLTIIVDYNDYLKILDIKTTYKIKVLNKYGLSKIKELIKTYLYLIIFTIIGIIINILLSSLIFKIEVIHPNKKLVKEIKRDLKDLGISKYSFKVSYNKLQKIKEKLKEKNNLEWIEIENTGTLYTIRLEERKIEKEEDICLPRNIISKKDSIILEIKSSSGEISKKINDYVSKGDILISGFIHNKDKIVSKRCAKGIVYGETWYKTKVIIPRNYTKEELTNNTNKGINIKLFNKKIDLHKKMSNFKRHHINIIKSNIIPVQLNYTKYQETKTINIIYDLNNVDDLALSLSEKEINKKLKENEEVLNKKVLKKTLKNSKIEVEVFLKVKEDITAYQDISKINIEEMNIEKE